VFDPEDDRSAQTGLFAGAVGGPFTGQESQGPPMQCKAIKNATTRKTKVIVADAQKHSTVSPQPTCPFLDFWRWTWIAVAISAGELIMASNMPSLGV
jgi:hypothetical protein